MIKPVSHRLQKRITDIGGLAENGQPLFRVMRGCDRFTLIGGEWKKYDKSGNYTGSHVGLERVLKHPEAKERYIFELWCPPENYGTPEEWKERFTECINGQFIEVLGPFPREGEYELVRVLKTPEKGAFVPLTEAICDALVATAKLNRELPARIKVAAAQDRREKEEKAKDQRLIDKLDNMAPAFEGKSFVTIPTPKEVRNYG
jgi:hypothetical protein